MKVYFKILLAATALMTLLPLLADAQSLKVTGRVTENLDSGPAPVIGAVVQVKGNAAGGSVTDADGNYSIAVSSPNQTLVFNCIGYDELEVPVNGRARIDVTLSASSELLDELVVVGYGVQKRSDVAGSVASIKADDLITYPATGIAEMMRGKASGVQVSISSGAPGSTSSILIRGVRSLESGANDPMYVIDGVVATATEFNSVNPDDVESLEILKDAASQAIYGARAANGVIIITTKR